MAFQGSKPYPYLDQWVTRGAVSYHSGSQVDPGTGRRTVFGAFVRNFAPFCLIGDIFK